jgi:uncharacterized protein YecT (DUF1311 family)
MMKMLALALFLGSATLAYAQTDCDKPRNDFDGLYCLNKVYLEADKELNENYKKVMAKLNDEGKATLRNTQRGWIEERNAECSRREGDQFFVNMSCATDMTIRRAQFLQDRYRECVAAGCQNSKL